jgi:hypothetical protein
VEEFWDAIGVGPAASANLCKMGLGPEIIEIPGSYIKLVTPAAELACIERLAAYCREHPEELAEQRQRRSQRNDRLRRASKPKVV